MMRANRAVRSALSADRINLKQIAKIQILPKLAKHLLRNSAAEPTTASGASGRFVSKAE
jgi:hypothetical protein